MLGLKLLGVRATVTLQSAERKEDGSESGAPFSVMVGNSIMAEKASDGAKIEHRLANVFPKTAAGDSVVHAHASL